MKYEIWGKNDLTCDKIAVSLCMIVHCVLLWNNNIIWYMIRFRLDPKKKEEKERIIRKKNEKLNIIFFFIVLIALRAGRS